MPLWRRRRSSLPDANVPADWIERRAWLDWEPPRNYIAGEARHLEALERIAGPTCEEGYCFAVPVEFVREPRNPYDGNAFRAEVGGYLVGHLRRHLAAQLASPLDSAGCSRFTVAGVVRGGSTSAPNLGVHVWLGRRLSPGPVIEIADDAHEVPWPPRELVDD